MEQGQGQGGPGAQDHARGHLREHIPPVEITASQDKKKRRKMKEG